MREKRRKCDILGKTVRCIEKVQAIAAVADCPRRKRFVGSSEQESIVRDGKAKG